MDSIGVIANIRKLEAGGGEIVEHFVGLAVRKNLRISVADYLRGFQLCSAVFYREEELPSQSDLIVTFGGDGTILHAAKVVGSRGTPILGVNLGRLGFLTEVAPDEIEEALERVLNGRYDIEERMILDIRADCFEEARFALNDIVIEKGTSFRLIEIEEVVSGELVRRYTADGLIISTPTGSTAYSLSAGGPIVHPEVDALIMTPICPHSLSARTVVVPSDRTISVRVRAGRDGAVLIVDGRLEVQLKPEDRVVVRKASHQINLVKLRRLSFYEVLRRKLIWGPDEKKTSLI